MKLFTLYTCILYLFIKNTIAVSKCNERILKKFMLSGMKYSIYDKMETCGQVHDKCCSVADEIKITKLWKERTNNILSNHIDTSLYYLNRITHHFYELGKLDPRLMTLKYISRKDVPYQEETCNYQMKDQDLFSKNQFESHKDVNLKKNLTPPPNKLVKPPVIDLKRYTHDQMGNRSWGVKISSSQLHIFRMFRHKFNFTENITERQTVCRKETTSFTKDFVIINENKAKYCYALYDKILDFDNRKFNTFLSNVKSGFKTLAKFKGALYCSVCDVHQQSFFDLKNKKFVYSKKFCRKLIVRNEPMLKYLHIIFIEYADFLLQYMECFESNAKQMEFPSPNFLNKYKRRIPLLRKCLKNINEEGWMEHCWFICDQYKIFGISKFFEGDILLFKRIHLGIYSFLRKLDRLKNMSKSINFDTIGTINGLLVEPLNPSHTISKKYYLENDIRKKILGVLDTRPKYSKTQLKHAKRFFELAKNTMGVSTVEGMMAKFKKLKIKKNKKIMKEIIYMQNVMKGKSKIKKAKLFGKKKIKFTKKGIPLISPINGLKNWWVKAKLDPKYNHAGKRPRELYQTNNHNQQNGYNNQNQQNGYNNNHSNNQNQQNGYNYKTNHQKKQNLKPLVYDREKHKNYQDYITSPQSLIENRTSKKLKYDFKKKLKEMDREEKLFDIEQKLKKDNKEKKKFAPKKKIIHSRIEPASEVYDKNFDELQLEKFEIIYRDDGMDPSNFIDLVDFDLDITGLIKKKFKLPEKVRNTVIHQYLSFYPKEINIFNHEIENVIMDGNQMQAVSHDYLEAKKKLDTEHFSKKYIWRGKIAQIKKRHGMKIKHKEDMKLLKKYKKKQKMEALDRMRNQKVVQNDHIDEEHFDGNFSGIKDFFVNMFGP